MFLSFTDLIDHFQFLNRHSGIPAVLFFIIFRKHFARLSQVSFCIVSISFLADFSNYILIWVAMYHKAHPGFNGLLIANIWRILDYILAAYFFKVVLPTKGRQILIPTIAFALTTLVSFSFFYTFYRANPIVHSLWSISIGYWCILAFSQLLSKPTIDNISKSPVFWFITGYFLFSTTTLISNIFKDFMIFELNVGSKFMYIHLFTLLFNILKNLMVFYGFTLVVKGHSDEPLQ